MDDGWPDDLLVFNSREAAEAYARKHRLKVVGEREDCLLAKPRSGKALRLAFYRGGGG